MLINLIKKKINYKFCFYREKIMRYYYCTYKLIINRKKRTFYA